MPVAPSTKPNLTLPGPQGVPQSPTPPAPNPSAAPVVVNSTQDSRIVWEDGNVAVIYARDFPAMTGMGRSRTRTQVGAAVAAPIEDALQTPVGAKSGGEFVKVWLKELLARPPLPAGTAGLPAMPVRLPLDPKDFRPVAPQIATGGTYKGKVIPDFPHPCVRCGGMMYQGNFSTVHPTPDGKCPADNVKPKKRGW